MKTIFFWGTPPPPIGGMTVHIERLSHYLSNQGWTVNFFNFSNSIHPNKNVKNINNLLFWYLSLFLQNRSSIHYVITTRSSIRFLASLLVLTGQKVILREGGRDLQKSSDFFLFKFLNIISLKICSCFIGVNNDICNFARKYKSSKKIFNINGFIHPPNLNVNIPNEILSFFGKSKLTFVASGKIFGKKNEDIHGLWSIIPFVKAALVKKIDIKLCVISYNYGKDNSCVRNEYINKIDEEGLSENILFYHSSTQLWPILKHSNYFIRSSITDGDSNAVREALALKNIVFSTDCVKRPEQCVLYKTGDIYDLLNKVLFVLNNESKFKDLTNHSRNEEKTEIILNNLIKK